MHLPKVYKYLHLIHHKSVYSSVLTSFAFHPFETIFQAVFLPMIIMILPLHIYALTAALVIMTISATINHGGVQIYPSGKSGCGFENGLLEQLIMIFTIENSIIISVCILLFGTD